jgi:hypothetical protein
MIEKTASPQESSVVHEDSQQLTNSTAKNPTTETADPHEVLT